MRKRKREKREEGLEFSHEGEEAEQCWAEGGCVDDTRSLPESL